MKLIIDSNERGEIAGALMEYFDDVKKRPLGPDSGDILVELDTGDAMIIERKSPSDLLASISDQRLFRQCENIAKMARFSFLVIDGTFKIATDGHIMTIRKGAGLVKSGWHIDHVQGALTRVQFLGVMVIQEEYNFALRIKRLADLCSRADKGHLNRTPLVSSPFDNETQNKIDFLGMLPGVGFERAKSLADATGDVPLIEMIAFAVNSGEMALPKLWGKITQDKIREYLGVRDGQKLIVTTRAEWKETT